MDVTFTSPDTIFVDPDYLLDDSKYGRALAAEIAQDVGAYIVNTVRNFPASAYLMAAPEPAVSVQVNGFDKDFQAPIFSISLQSLANDHLHGFEPRDMEPQTVDEARKIISALRAAADRIESDLAKLCD